MAQKTNSFEKFWQELKRRKVVHVITVYAAIAFVILQLIDMVSEPLHFPEWTQGFIIVLLCIGFVIAVFLSWIYDITPAGIKKTKPASALKHTSQSTIPSSGGWRIATYVSSVIIIALLAFNFISRRNLGSDISKLARSIAVLPFRNDSPDTTNAYFINGIMERITTNLQMVKELRVISRNSVEKYRDNKTKSAPEIAEDLGVNYIVEGSGQKIGNSISVTTQLIKAKGKETHLWAKTYDQKINEVNDYFKIQSEIAEKIAEELKTAIAPEEKRLIEITPTTSLTAYDFYLRGNDYDSRDKRPLAVEMYTKAIQHDSLFVEAYARRAIVHTYLYWEKQENWQGHVLKAKEDIKIGSHLNPELPEIRLAEAVVLYQVDRNYDKSLKILNKLKNERPNMEDLYAYCSYVFRRQGNLEESINEAKRSIQIDPFNADYIDNLLITYSLLHRYDSTIESSKQGLSLIPDYKSFNFQIYYAYLNKTGDLKIAIKESGLTEQDFQYDVYYFNREYKKLIDFIKKDSSINFSNQLSYEPKTYRLAAIYYLNNSKSLCKIYADSAIVHLLRKIKDTPDDDRLFSTLGKCYALSGKDKEAIAYGEKAVDLKPIKLDAYQGVSKEQDLMEIYILTGNYDKALNKIEYLLSIPSWMSIGQLIIDPLYDNLRSLPRFKEIISSAQIVKKPPK
jgi:TolB-like protein